MSAGAQLVVVQTNNSTFGHTAETYQQLAMAQLRAVETGRTVVQAATTGKSAIIVPDGTISDRSMNFEPFDLEAAHIYKIYGGKMHEIEAMGFTLPLNSKNSWSPFIK